MWFIKEICKFNNDNKKHFPFFILNDCVDKEKYDFIILKYDNLIKDCAFEEIPIKYKEHVSKIYTDANKHIPIQLNGTIGHIIKQKRDSRNEIEPINV